MKKGYPKSGAAVFSLGFLLLAGPLSAQEPILVSYERNFMRANLAAKEDILRDAATDEQAAGFIGPLYEYALGFSLQNVEILGDDPDMISLTVFAAREMGEAGYGNGVDMLRLIFSVYQDSVVRVAVLGSLAVLGKGNPVVAEELNQFLSTQHTRYRSGAAPDYPVLLACIKALGSLGEASSFPVLFTALGAGYPEAVVREAAAALNALRGDYQQFLAAVIQQDPPREKFIAFNAGAYNPALSDAQRGELAEKALEISLDLSPGDPEGAAAAVNMRYAAALVLRDLKWSRAAELLIRHFYRVQRDYGTGAASRDRFLESISCLGAMSSSEAAQVLALQLGYFNSQMERNGEYDEAVTLGVVRALGEIGDKIAFDYLLYISYLAYPETIKTAARDALNRLRW
jgi:HEAT repeat protein